MFHGCTLYMNSHSTDTGICYPPSLTMSTDSRSSCCNVCTESSTHVDATALRLDRIYLKKLRYLLEDYVWLESVVGPDHTAFLHEPMGHHTNIFHGLIGRHDRLKWLLNQSHLWGPFGPETTMGAWWGSMLAEMEQATAARDALWEEFREEFEGEAQMTGERMPEPTWVRRGPEGRELGWSPQWVLDEKEWRCRTWR